MFSIRRFIILPLLAALSLHASAYIDHRNAHVDSLEAVLASQNPPKGKASGDSLMMTFPKKGLVGVYFNTGHYDKALRTADEALAYFSTHREEEPVDYATTLAHKARILLNQNRPLDSAKACVEEALPYIKDEMQFDDASTIYMAACHRWKCSTRHARRKRR